MTAFAKKGCIEVVKSVCLIVGLRFKSCLSLVDVVAFDGSFLIAPINPNIPRKTDRIRVPEHT